MARIIIRNGTVVDPTQNLCDTADIYIEDDIIKAVQKDITLPCDKVYEAKNMYVMPGLVDMHVHLRDPGPTYKEDIYTGSNAALAGGVTSMLCMPNTDPTIDNQETINYINENVSRTRARIYICGAISKGLNGDELADFDMYEKNDIVAVSDDGRPVKSDALMLEALKQAKKHGLLVTSHCEDLDIVNGGIINLGKVSKQLQVAGIDRQSENIATQRDIDLCKEYGLRIHICHVSTKEAVEAIRKAKKEGVKITCETCPHYFAYTDEKLLKKDADYRMNPPLREETDRLAIIEGIKDGTIDCIATDHAPHTKKEKSDFLTAPNGVVGLETSLSAGVRFLVENGHIDMLTLTKLMSTNPARILGISGGNLKVGNIADIILFDKNVVWTVLPERLNSKSKNTAFKFERLQGRVKYAFVSGELCYVMRY
ncbi:MAG: dihydroorotase [Oscillospiraceae bacterium]